MQPIHLPNPETQFDLLMRMAEGDTDLYGELEFDAALFDEATIRRLVSAFSVLVKDIAQLPSRVVSDFALLTAVEARELTTEWNGRFRHFEQRPCLDELVHA